MEKQDDKTGIRAIIRAVDMIICLNNNINSLTEISKKCGISNSTAHRLLKTLRQVNLVTQDPTTHHYYLGPLVIELTTNYRATHQHLITCAMKEMQRLSIITQERIELATLVEARYIRLHEIESTRGLRVIEDAKGRGQPFIGAPAKVLLSQLSEENLGVLLSNVKLVRLTKRSLINKKKLLAQIRTIKQQGYAISYGERVPGGIGIAAPILNYVSPVVLFIVGAEINVKFQIDKYRDELIESVRRISEKIGETFQPIK